MGTEKICLTQSSKPEKNDPFDLIPEDLKVEILMRLPAKSIAKLSLVSESCLSITYRKDFKNLYMNRSLTQPRLLYTIYRSNIQEQYFQSCSLKNPPSDQHRVNILNSSDRYDFSPPVHGLIHCTNGDNDVMIGNPTTGQFVTLLRYKASDGSIFSFLGYDPVNDVYKVLCLKVRFSLNVMSTEHQVLTLGSTQKWKTIECKHPHYPTRGTKGICINGVVYYLARVKKLQSLICFDLANEDFTVIKLRKSCPFIANYNRKVALSNVLYLMDQVVLWVLEDSKKQEWSKVYISDRYWWFDDEYELEMQQQYKFRGILSTGELILSPYSSSDSLFILCKDEFEEVSSQRFRVSYASVEVYLDHIESPMFLSKLS